MATWQYAFLCTLFFLGTSASTESTQDEGKGSTLTKTSSNYIFLSDVLSDSGNYSDTDTRGNTEDEKSETEDEDEEEQTYEGSDGETEYIEENETVLVVDDDSDGEIHNYRLASFKKRIPILKLPSLKIEG